MQTRETERRDFGTTPEAATVRFERLLPGPIERLWAYLTDPEKRSLWLAGGPMELRPGGRVELRFRNADLSPIHEPTPERWEEYEEATVHGRVTRCEPRRLLSYTWDEESAVDSEVTFELTPRGTEVLLVITHRRLVERATRIGVASGWHTHLDILQDRLQDRSPRPFWSTHTELEAEYERRLPR